jgi:hypothetical protein
MKLVSVQKWVMGLLVLLCISFLLQPVPAAAAEETFNVLQIGTRTFTNVTVTTKTTSQIFIIHASGMNTIKVADLSPDLRTKLGYEGAEEPKKTKGLAAVGASIKHSKFTAQMPQLKQFQQQWRTHGPANLATIKWSPSFVAIFCIGAVLLYLFFSFCGMLICDKAGHPPGILIWVPLLQLIPLLRAAGMSLGWIVAFLIPGLNLMAHIVWCFKIAEARGKTAWTGLFLILPFTSIFAYLYLALSNGAQKKERKSPGVEIMTLEAA